MMHRRPRRNRRSHSIREGIRETDLRPSRLVQPLFLVPGKRIKEEISSLPGQYRFSEDMVYPMIDHCLKYGVTHFILFPAVPESDKDSTGTYSYSPDNFYLRIAEKVKNKYGEFVTLISDVALDPYSSDGHDGIVREGKVLNDETLKVLNKMAVAQAEVGFDIIGPSDMMDGRVHSIRAALDGKGYSDVGIMSYTAKYASAFYGPFREALDSAPKDGDKKTYQMDPANRREALLEAALDESEGADYLMVKPALHYMDIISDLRDQSQLPVACYHVSGECSMLLAASQNGWLDFEVAMPETLLSLRRAGADLIITYFAADYASWYFQRRASGD